MESLRIVGLAVLAAVIYGIVHDQITARICVEYFTIGHPPVFRTDDPTLLGLGWGVIATWWVGVLLGIPLAVAAQAGSQPPRRAGSLVVPLLRLLAVMAVSAMIAGVTGWCLARTVAVRLGGRMSYLVPPERHVAFLTDLWAHSASYTVGVVGGAILIAQVWRSRRRADTLA